MQRRAVRVTLLALLLITGLTAAFFTWDAHARFRADLAIAHDVDARLDRMHAAVAALGASQQAYVAPGQQRGDALTRASVLVQQLYDDMAALRRGARSGDAPSGLLAFGKTLDALVNIDDRAREHLRQEQALMAADLLYTEARQALEEMTAQLDVVAAAEIRAAESERRALLTREASALGGAAVFWLLGLVALAHVPKKMNGVTADAPPAATTVEAAQPVPQTPVDLSAAARVCADLARVSSQSALPVTLAHAARVLDASGLIVWLGAGEELFPVTAHGYGPRTLAKFGPVPRGGNNATAAAWRTSSLSIARGVEGGNGAIVAPLVGHEGCFGVMSAEVKAGRETDEAAQAVAAIIAAQLSTVVAPWPAASRAQDEAPARTDQGLPGTLDTGDGDRAAASA